MAREKNFYGRTQEEVIQQTLKTAAFEAVSLGEIVSDGQMFELEEGELVAFVRKAILALLESGARIVEQSVDKGDEWLAVPKFDLPQEQVIDKVIQMWETKGREAAFLVWFYRGSVE